MTVTVGSARLDAVLNQGHRQSLNLIFTDCGIDDGTRGVSKLNWGEKKKKKKQNKSKGKKRTIRKENSDSIGEYTDDENNGEGDGEAK